MGAGGKLKLLLKEDVFMLANDEGFAVITATELGPDIVRFEDEHLP